MYWTYDPLVARNAHLNLNRLGVSVAEFVSDMYGDSDSSRHQLGTDRFIVRWDLNGDPRGSPARRDWSAPPAGVSRTVIGRPEDAGCDPPPAADELEVVIPNDIEAVAEHSLAEAFGWRYSCRQAFTPTCLPTATK